MKDEDQKEVFGLVAEAKSKHLEVLERVRLKVPDKASIKIQDIIDRKIFIPAIRVGDELNDD